MKLLAVAALILLAPKPDVRFESSGVRVGDALVQGAVLELKSSGAASLLASGSSIESLASALDVEVAPGRAMNLEPGLRIARGEGGFQLTTHGSRAVRFSTGDESFAAGSPVRIAVTAEGWTVGDRAVSGGALRASLQNQDDADANLERMKQSAEKMRTPNSSGVPKLSERKIRIFRGNPLMSGEAIDSISIRLIPQISPSGAP